MKEKLAFDPKSEQTIVTPDRWQLYQFRCPETGTLTFKLVYVAWNGEFPFEVLVSASLTNFQLQYTTAVFNTLSNKVFRCKLTSEQLMSHEEYTMDVTGIGFFEIYDKFNPFEITFTEYLRYHE